MENTVYVETSKTSMFDYMLSEGSVLPVRTTADFTRDLVAHLAVKVSGDHCSPRNEGRVPAIRLTDVWSDLMPLFVKR